MFKKAAVLALAAACLAPLRAGAAEDPSPYLHWDATPAEIASGCAAAMKESDGRLAALAALDVSSRTFQNTVREFDQIQMDLQDETASDAFLKEVSVSSAVRAAALDCETQLDQYGVDLYSRPELYAALRAYADKKEPLDAVDAKLLDKTLLDYKHNGFGEPPEVRLQVRILKDRLVADEAAFEQNLNEVSDYLAVTKKELRGLPEDYVSRLEKLPDGRYKVTLDYPDYYPFMRNAKDAEARRKLEFLFDNRAAAKNVPLFEEALALRQRIAALLGYPDWASYVEEDRMAHDPKTVNAFLERLRGRLRKKAEEELAEFKALKRKEEGPADASVIRAWDYQYYDNELRKTKYDVDEEAVRQYFPAERVVRQLLAIYQQLFGVKFTPVPDGAVWHPDVKLFRINDADSGALIGWFYMDLFPRDGKYKHAAAFQLISGRVLDDGTYEKPVSAILANLNPGTAQEPGLLSHDEVETLFHEFGHVMHQTLTKARYGRFSGSNVSQDFIEAPSQMLENWVWNRDILLAVSGYYKDQNKKLPSALIKRMLAARNFDSGLRYSRQLAYAMVDMAYHTDPFGADVPPIGLDASTAAVAASSGTVDSTALYAKYMLDVSLIPMTPGTHPQASFGHLMGGYDAAYYGYLWSQVYADDLFSRFDKEGVLNGELGRAYRKAVLERGRERDEMDDLRDFLGREPNEDAFFKTIGLTAAKDR